MERGHPTFAKVRISGAPLRCTASGTR